MWDFFPIIYQLMGHIYERYDNKKRHNMVIYTCILICYELYENKNRLYSYANFNLLRVLWKKSRQYGYYKC